MVGKRLSSLPTHSLYKALLPYPIRQCAAKEMLYGGVRLNSLVPIAPRLSKTFSERLNIPTPREELRAMQLDYVDTSIKMMPLNVGHQTKYDMSIIRNKDVLRRWLSFNRAFYNSGSRRANGCDVKPVGTAGVSDENVNSSGQYIDSTLISRSGAPSSSLEAREGLLKVRSRQMFHLKREHLGVTAATDRVGTATEAFEAQVPLFVDTVGSEVFGVTDHLSNGSTRVFMPLQMIKPMHHAFSPAQRTSGLTNPAGRFKQELLDRKGFGWQKKQRKLWNQDALGTRGYRPAKFY